MTSARITVEVPHGPPVEHPWPESTGSAATLSDWLEEHGVPLNTRCGRRGLCRGCQVELVASSQRELVRSCRMACADLPEPPLLIRVPENSWRDQSLHGVSTFEIRRPMDPPPPRDGVGLALDIGTTTVAAALWDFRTGRCLATGSRANGQIRYGDNVLSRITFAVEEPDGGERLQRALVQDTLVPLIADRCREAGVAGADITEATAAGNPAMLHTLAGESLHGLSRYPFRPVFLDAWTLPGGAVGLGGDYSLRLLPSLGPFVGADIAAGALAAGLLQMDQAALLIDFGTNGEILLRTRDGFLATATAAGPAFEGGRLTCGAPARTGVVAGFDLSHGGWKASLVEGEGKPSAGISGAAYIDFLALGRRTGLLNRFGRFETDQPRVVTRHIDGQPERVVEVGGGLHISEADVAELLQAKAAISGGVATLLELANLEPGDLAGVFVAGGFGYHLRPDHARAVGLLPEVPMEKVELIGNASLGGASLLLHDQAVDLVDQLKAGCEVIELNQVESFEDHFTDALMLGKPTD